MAIVWSLSVLTTVKYGYDMVKYELCVMNISSDKHHCAKQKYIDIFLAMVLYKV